MLFGLEVAASGRYVRLRNDDCIRGDRCFQGNRIASTSHAYRLSINGRSTILADHAIGSFEESHRAADLAGIENRGNLAIWLLIEPEADFDLTFLRGEPMQISVRHLGERNACFPIHK